MTTAFQSSAFQNNAFQIDEAIEGGGGRIRHLGRMAQYNVEDEGEKLARRIREGTIPAPAVVKPDVQSKYVAESARLARGIAKARDEARAYRKEIERLEAAQVKRQTAKLQRELLRAQQALQLVTVQEAVFLEEMEVVDVAFVASAVISAVLQ